MFTRLPHARARAIINCHKPSNDFSSLQYYCAEGTTSRQVNSNHTVHTQYSMHVSPEITPPRRLGALLLHFLRIRVNETRKGQRKNEREKHTHNAPKKIKTLCSRTTPSARSLSYWSTLVPPWPKLRNYVCLHVCAIFQPPKSAPEFCGRGASWRQQQAKQMSKQHAAWRSFFKMDGQISAREETPRQQL